MAINPTFASTPVISKVKLGSSTYYVKDADLRVIVSAFGNATAKDWTASVAEDGTDLPTAGAVHSAIQAAVADLEGSMHFLGVSSTDPSTGTVTIDGEVVTGAAGDVVLYGSKEFVYGGSPASWHEVGDEGLWVPNTRTIAGINLQNNITVAALQAALELRSLAYANTASATVTDYVTGINGATYTPAGTISADESGYQITGANEASNVAITPTTTAVAAEGVVASIGSGEAGEPDTETLILTPANTESVWTGYSSATAAAQTFTGGKIGFSGIEDTITPTLTTGNKTITVSPDPII